jgi:hypothetical protein
MSSHYPKLNAQGWAYACKRSFMLNSYLTRILVCRIIVRREINSAFEVGVDSSVGNETVAVIEEGEFGAEPGVACRLSEERVLIMVVAFLSVVRKSSTGGIVRVCNRIQAYAPTFVE